MGTEWAGATERVRVIVTYTVEEFAAQYIAGRGIADKDPVRWVKSRIKRGDIPAKQVARGKWILTDKHIEEWLTADTMPVATETSATQRTQRVMQVGGPMTDGLVNPIADGLSQRSKRRLRGRVSEASESV